MNSTDRTHFAVPKKYGTARTLLAVIRYISLAAPVILTILAGFVWPNNTISAVAGVFVGASIYSAFTVTYIELCEAVLDIEHGTRVNRELLKEIETNTTDES